MNIATKLTHPSELVSNDSSVFRPPSFPPPEDWPVSIDKDGNPLSLYGDGYWNMRVFGFYGFNFEKKQFSPENESLFKQFMLLVIYHPQVFPGKISTCKAHFTTLSQLIGFCEGHKILISQLVNFPHLFVDAAKHLQTKRILDRISQLHKLNLYAQDFGLAIGGEKFLKVMSRLAITSEAIQHPYIPPRIWNYQLKRMNEVLDDFESHSEQIEKAYNWLFDAYNYNYNIKPKYASPFNRESLNSKRILYPKNCEGFLEDYGLLELIEKWMTRITKQQSNFTPSSISAYLSFVRDVAIIFILNFSMQRKSETTSLRSDCFKIENDPRLGKICTISGETTKTDPDSDARWVVPEKVKKAVDIAAKIAKLRLKSVPPEFNVPPDLLENPYLKSPNFEPWSPSRGFRLSEKEVIEKLEYFKRSIDYLDLSRRRSKIFDESEMLITEEDARIALALTPNLDQKPWFKVGQPWRLTSHQVRRTLAVNMFASPEISTSSIQHQMKHFSRNMTLYYGRNYANISLDPKVQRTLIAESYASMYRKLIEVADNDVDYVRPHNTNQQLNSVINIINSNEEEKLHQLIKKGRVNCRKTLLGFCMANGSCKYGGIESITKCAGSDGRSICADAIFSKKNKNALVKLKSKYESELAELTRENVRYEALKLEIYAIEVYLHVIDK